MITIKRLRRKEWKYTIIKFLFYLWSGIINIISRQTVMYKDVYYKLQSNHLNNNKTQRVIGGMLTKEMRWNKKNKTLNTKEDRKICKKEQRKDRQMIDLNQIIKMTWNANALNAPLKRQRLSYWIKKKKSEIQLIMSPKSSFKM